MRTYATVKDYKIDVKGNALLIYTAVQDIDALADCLQSSRLLRRKYTSCMTILRQDDPLLAYAGLPACRCHTPHVSDATLLLPRVGG